MRVTLESNWNQIGGARFEPFTPEEHQFLRIGFCFYCSIPIISSTNLAINPYGHSEWGYKLKKKGVLGNKSIRTMARSKHGSKFAWALNLSYHSTKNTNVSMPLV